MNLSKIATEYEPKRALINMVFLSLLISGCIALILVKSTNTIILIVNLWRALPPAQKIRCIYKRFPAPFPISNNIDFETWGGLCVRLVCVGNKSSVVIPADLIIAITINIF